MRCCRARWEGGLLTRFGVRLEVNGLSCWTGIIRAGESVGDSVCVVLLVTALSLSLPLLLPLLESILLHLRLTMNSQRPITTETTIMTSVESGSRPTQMMGTKSWASFFFFPQRGPWYHLLENSHWKSAMADQQRRHCRSNYEQQEDASSSSEANLKALWISSGMLNLAWSKARWWARTKAIGNENKYDIMIWDDLVSEGGNEGVGGPNEWC